MAPGGTLDQVDGLLAARRFAEAARMLLVAAGAGETAAIAELAHWRIVGNLIRRDLPEARRLLALAAAKGDKPAALLHSGFLAAGVGGPDDWAGALVGLRSLARREARAAEQLRLIDSMDLDEDGFPARPFELQGLGEAPYVASARDFMTEAECDYLMKAAEPGLQPSVVVDPVTRRPVPHPIRKSDGALFGVYAEDLVVNAFNRRIAALSETRLDQGEPLQLLRYRPGGEYKPHMDALPGEPNQRVLTVLVYLSGDYEGGETAFPHSGLSFRGRRGDALLFRNAGPDGRPDPASLHAGLPVTKGVKYLASRWIRAGKFTYPPPPPILEL
ncbi:MAG TPA: 2OG-Fe(II) oxygenase [Allosphingosinicella sp.]|nr:2OG-Fe(II) oxygenase [Allosphingosinicella sp.]